MAEDTQGLAARFMTEDNARQRILDRARKCAALSKPWILPPKNQKPEDDLSDNYQSVGSNGMTSLSGKMLLALYPPGFPWFELKLASEIQYAPDVPDEVKAEFSHTLYLQELLIQSMLESANLDTSNYRRRVGFRTRKRMVIDQVLITGDALEYLDPQYRLKTFRRDQYITKRDTSTDVLYHIVKERIDPLNLEPAHLSASKLDRAKLEAMPVADRMQDIYTLVEWQPLTKVWLIRQEVNDNIIAESEEPVSPYFATAFELVPGEDYGRGLVELNLGNLKSLDELEERRLEMMGLAAKALIFIDQNSMVRDADLQKKSGAIVRGARVSGGQVTDVGTLGFGNVKEFSMLTEGIRHKTEQLGKSFLTESASQPTGERVTRFQVQRIAMELEDGLGGMYAPIADDQQTPLLHRMIHQLKRDNLMPAIPNEAMRIETTTGLAALSREARASKTMTLVQAIAQLGPQAMNKINTDVLIDVLARYQGVYEPGLIKSEEQMAQEQQAAAQQQMQQQVAGKAIDTVGNVAQEAALAQIQGAPQ